MLIYNLIPALTADQFLAVLGLEGLFLVLTLTFFKKQLTLRVIIFSGMLAVVLALLSSLIGNGAYGGMMYHERFGWPFPFLTVSRNIEVGFLVGVPFAFHLYLLKLLATIAFWVIFPLGVMLNLKAEKRYNRFSAILSFVFLLLVLFLCLTNAKMLAGTADVPTSEVIAPVMTPDPKVVQIMREKIENTFPEFADFESQPSFAGQSVKIVLEDGEYYFAYLTLGSGLPIVKATCFRVDWKTAYKIGEFPNPYDSYLGYLEVDPQTCKGIR